MNLDKQIIGLDYYDGVTEGFLEHSHGWTYFRMLAWDTGQDRRLFVCTEVEVLILERLFAMLGKVEPRPVSKSWLPRWHFENGIDENNANIIIESLREEAAKGACFVYGPSFESGGIIKLDSDYVKVEAAKILKAMERTENLSIWINESG